MKKIKQAEPGETAAQRAYYAATADRYDDMHIHERDEHYFALCVMIAFLDFLNIRSILDIGSGTGRALIEVKRRAPEVRVTGIEPSPELREQGFRKGLTVRELTDGDAQQLRYADGEFDLVCAYGALHHIPDPGKAISEMLRVSKRAIFISDSNNFGQGRPMVRGLKQIIDSLGLWPLANYLKTGGKGYDVSDGDGITYSFSVFNHYPQIRAVCRSVHFTNTSDASPALYRSASHVALLGIK